ncbi:hypothetical protein pb186bvf_006170 [Paramecium bursaria]
MLIQIFCHGFIAKFCNTLLVRTEINFETLQLVQSGLFIA